MHNLTAWGVCALLASAQYLGDALRIVEVDADDLGATLPDSVADPTSAWYAWAATEEAWAMRSARRNGVHTRDATAARLRAHCEHERTRLDERDHQLTTPVPW